MMKTLMRCLFALLLCNIGTVAAEPMQRGALSPSAPVRLDYELPDELPASGEFVLTLNLSTPIRSGQLAFEVVSSEGLSIIEGSEATCSLQQVTQPVPHTLKMVLSADAVRFVIVQVSVDGPMGSLSRSYRIDLSLPVAPQAAPKSSLKLMPATKLR